MSESRAKYEQLVQEYRILRADMEILELKYSKMMDKSIELTDALIQLEDELWRDGQLE